MNVLRAVAIAAVAAFAGCGHHGKLRVTYDEYEQKTLKVVTSPMFGNSVLALASWVPRDDDLVTMRFGASNIEPRWVGCERVNLWADGEIYKPPFVTHSSGKASEVLVYSDAVETVTFEVPDKYLRTLILADESKVLICGRDEFWFTTKNAKHMAMFYDEVVGEG